MKKIILFIILGISVTTYLYAQQSGAGGSGVKIKSEASHPLRHKALRIRVDDDGDYYDGRDNVEDVLTALATGDIVNTIYLKLDGSNADTTIDIGSQDFTTTGTGTFGNGIFNTAKADADFRISGQGLTNMFYVDASTNQIGIGSTPSGYTFHVRGGSATLRTEGDASIGGVLTIDSLKFGAGESTWITNDHSPTLYRTNGSGGAFPFTEAGHLIVQPRTSAGRSIILSTGSTTPAERVLIDSSGNVGIGTTSPGVTLQVGDDNDGEDVKFYGATSGSYMLWDESADTLVVVGGDIDVRDDTPHLQFIPDSGDAFEFYGYGDEFYCVNVTDSQPVWRIGTDNQIFLFDRNLTTTGIGDFGSIVLENDEFISNATDGKIRFGGAGGTYNNWIDFNLDASSYLVRIDTNTTSSGFQFMQNVGFDDNKRFWFGSNDAGFLWNTVGGDSFQLYTRVAATAGTGLISIVDRDSYNAANRNPTTLFTDPRVRIYASGSASADDYIEFYHDQTDGVINVGVGDLKVIDDLTTGIDGTGVDVKFYGDTSGAYMLWDESGDDLYFTGSGSGLPFADMYAADANDTITIAAQGKANKVQITSFDTDGGSNNATPDHTNDHITIVKAGMYLCNVSMHIKSAAAGGADTFGYSVYKNNGATEFANLHGQRDVAGGGGDEGSISLSGIIDLAVNDTIEVWVWNIDSTDNIIVDDINLSLVQCGGT